MSYPVSVRCFMIKRPMSCDYNLVLELHPYQSASACVTRIGEYKHNYFRNKDCGCHGYFILLNPMKVSFPRSLENPDKKTFFFSNDC